jgi:hypothetical protein
MPTTTPSPASIQLECARQLIPGIQPSSVRAALSVGRAIRRIMSQHPAFTEFVAVAYLADTQPATYSLFSKAVRRDAAFSANTMDLNKFVERFDAIKSARNNRRVESAA